MALFAAWRVASAVQYKADSFLPVCQVFENVFVLAAGPGTPLKNFADAVAKGKAKPGSLTYAHPGVSSSPHLAGAELFQRAGVQATDVPYRGEAAMVSQLREHAVDLGVVTTGFAVTQEMKPLAVFADKRLVNFPDTPTVKELGYPVTASGYGGLFVRAGTPAPIVARIEEACKAATADPGFKEMAQRQYQQTDYLDRVQFVARLQADAKSKGELLKSVKLDR